MNYKELIEVKVENLKFDLKNPRLPKRLYGANDEKVIEWMLLDASLIDLIASIATNGFFPGEPLLAIEEPATENYIVIEGNRRLASCKILNNPKIANVKSKSIASIIEESDKNNIPKKLPVFLFEQREDILAYLGYRHVTGVKSWGALPKAKYLFELYELDQTNRTLKDKCKSLAQKIGSRSDYVLKLLTSYELFQLLESKQFYQIKDLSEETIEFSNLVDAATRFGNISTYLNIDFYSENPLGNLNLDNFKELSEWLFRRDENDRTLVGENRNIRLLNSIVAAPRALEEFKKNGNIKDAYLLTSVPDEIFTKSISSSYKNLINAKEVVSTVSLMVKNSSIDSLESIKSLVKKLLKEID